MRTWAEEEGREKAGAGRVGAEGGGGPGGACRYYSGMLRFAGEGAR